MPILAHYYRSQVRGIHVLDEGRACGKPPRVDKPSGGRGPGRVSS